MIGPGEVIIALIIIGLPTIMLDACIVNRYFRLREKRLEIEAGMAAEKAAQYAVAHARARAALRVIEQIVTDRGIETAAPDRGACASQAGSPSDETVK